MNITLPNQIVINVSQSPAAPLPGDTVVFSTQTILENAIDYEYSDNLNYFYSYNWLVSRDNGLSFVSAGPDLDTLTIENISQSFFGEIYKLEVTLIDLSNMLLTEDGDVLTSHRGEVLLSDTASLLSIQNEDPVPEPNSHAVDIANKSAPTEQALDLLDVVSNTNELAEFDPLIDEETADIINSAQGISARESVSQNISNNPIEIFVDDFVDESEIVLPTQSQNFSIQNTWYKRVPIFQRVACKTNLMYLDCQPSYEGVTGAYSSLEACMGGNSACNFNDPNNMVTIQLKEPHNIGIIPTKKITTTNYKENIAIKDIKQEYEFKCCLNPEVVCSGGLAKCGDGDQWTADNTNGSGCDINKYNDGPEQLVAATDDDTNLCGCDNPVPVFVPVTNNGSGGFSLASYSISAIVEIAQQQARIRPINSSSPAAIEAQQGILNTESGTGELKMGENRGGRGSVKLIVAAIATILGIGVVYGAYLWWNNKPVQAYTCRKRYLKKLIKCENGPIIELSSDPRVVGGEDVTTDFSDREQDINTGLSPNYNCVCQRGDQIYTGSVSVIKDKDSCDWYITSHIGQPGSKCRCSLTTQNLEGSTIQPNYEFDIPSTPPSCEEKPDLFYHESNTACLFSKTAGEFRDCYVASGKCSAQCTSFSGWSFSGEPTNLPPGFHCCSNETTVFTIAINQVVDKRCNEAIDVPIELETSLDLSVFDPSSLPINKNLSLKTCDPDSLNTTKVVIASIIKRPKECNDIIDNINIFDSYDKAKKAIITSQSEDSYITINKYEPQQDMTNKQVLSPEISVNGAIIAPELNSYFRIVYNGYETVGELCGELCKPWYTFSTGSDSHPCNDSAAPNITCGNQSVPVAGTCNNSDSTESTTITIATITRKLSFSKEELETFKKDSNYSPDCGAIIAKAESAVEKGIICTDW